MQGRRDLLVFDISGQFCALPLEDLLEIVPMAALSHPPGMPAMLEGFLNLRGTAVPIVCLNRMFRLREKPLELYSPILVIRARDYPIGFLVDHVTRTLSFAGKDAVPLKDDDSFNGCAEAQFVAADGVIHLLSPERLLIEKQRQCLFEFQAVEQHRLTQLQAKQC